MTQNKTLQTERLILRAWQESDAEALYKYAQNPLRRLRGVKFDGIAAILSGFSGFVFRRSRSEERRVGKECRSRWSPYH